MRKSSRIMDQHREQSVARANAHQDGMAENFAVNQGTSCLDIAAVQRLATGWHGVAGHDKACIGNNNNNLGGLSERHTNLDKTKHFNIKMLRDLREESMKTGLWYIVVDAGILLKDFAFIYRFVHQDKNCRMLIPHAVKTYIGDMSLSDCLESHYGYTARQLRQRLGNAATHMTVQHVSKYNNDNMRMIDSILYCYHEVRAQKYHGVIVTTDHYLYGKANAINVHCFKLQDLKENETDTEKDNPIKKSDKMIQVSDLTDKNSHETIDICNILQKHSKYTGGDTQELNQHNLEEYLGVFTVKNKIMADRITSRIDEWLCCFKQTLEEAISAIIFQELYSRNRLNKKFFFPWPLLDYIHSLPELYKYDNVTAVVTKLSPMLSHIINGVKSGTNMNAIDFMRLIGLGLLLLQSIKNITLPSPYLENGIERLVNILDEMEDPERDVDVDSDLCYSAGDCSLDNERCSKDLEKVPNDSQLATVKGPKKRTVLRFKGCQKVIVNKVVKAKEENSNKRVGKDENSDKRVGKDENSDKRVGKDENSDKSRNVDVSNDSEIVSETESDMPKIISAKLIVCNLTSEVRGYFTTLQQFLKKTSESLRSGKLQQEEKNNIKFKIDISLKCIENLIIQFNGILDREASTLTNMEAVLAKHGIKLLDAHLLVKYRSTVNKLKDAAGTIKILLEMLQTDVLKE